MEVSESLTENAWCNLSSISLFATRVDSLALEQPEPLFAGGGEVEVGGAGTGTEDLLPKAVVGLAVLLPSQSLHCPCVQ